MKLIILALICILIIFTVYQSIQSCPNQTRLEKEIGSEAFSNLKSSKEIIVQRSENQLVLNAEQVDQILSILTKDSSYHFDISKNCPFLKEISLKFSSESQLVCFISFSCLKIKFVTNNREILLDLTSKSGNNLKEILQLY